MFRPMCGRHSSRQAELPGLESAGHGRESGLSCCECGAPLVETECGWVCCPNGHGKLLDESEPFGAWFEDELPGEDD